jgi:RimJ/RimL family protein N-acetyltransferase
MSGPYALEAKILVFDFAFEILQISRIINETRIENKNMNSIGKRMGFSLVEEFEKNGVRHNLYELTKENYRREYLEKTLERWSKRNQ